MSKRKKILLVEDDPNFGSILNDYLNLHTTTNKGFVKAKVLWLGDDEKTGQLPDISEAADIFFNEYPDLGEKTEYYFPHDGQSWALQEPFIDWIQDKYPKFAKTSYRKHGGGSQTENLYDFVMAVSRLYADEILKDDTKLSYNQKINVKYPRKPEAIRLFNER